MKVKERAAEEAVQHRTIARLARQDFPLRGTQRDTQSQVTPAHTRTRKVSTPSSYKTPRLVRLHRLVQDTEADVTQRSFVGSSQCNAPGHANSTHQLVQGFEADALIRGLGCPGGGREHWPATLPVHLS